MQVSFSDAYSVMDIDRLGNTARRDMYVHDATQSSQMIRMLNTYHEL